jgi:hypothetical protein
MTSNLLLYVFVIINKLEHQNSPSLLNIYSIIIYLTKEKEKKEVIIDECKISRDLFYRKISELFFFLKKK